MSNLPGVSEGKNNLPGKATLKSVESECKKITENRSYCKKKKKIRAGKGKACRKTDFIVSDRILGLIVMLKKLRDHLIRAKSSNKSNNVSDDLVTKHICVLEKLPNVLKVKQEEDGQLLDGLESELSSIKTLCDQANIEFEHMHDADKEKEWSYFESEGSVVRIYSRGGAYRKVKRLVTALHKLYDLIPGLVSSETTLGNSVMELRKLGIEIERARYDPIRVPSLTFEGTKLSTLVEDREINMIDIKSCDMFFKHLGIARISHTPVVILFYSKDIKLCKEFLPHFDELRSQYLQFREVPIKFYRVDVKRAFKVFGIKRFPTVVVMRRSAFRLIEVERISIDETIIVPAFVRETKKLLDECFWVD